MTTRVNCIEKSVDEKKNVSSTFIIEPLETGQGITLGNSLRRTLLSDLTGFAITGVRINNLKHEFAVIDGIREDVLEVLLNLKEIVFKPALILKKRISDSKSTVPLKFKSFVNLTGPVVVTAGMLNLPKNLFQIINPHQYICTVVDTSEFYMEIDIENGVGYQLTDEARKKNVQERLAILKPSTLLVDSIFMPVKQVNYKIQLIHDSQGNIKESLHLDILTNGSISPKRSLQEAIKILLNLLYPLLLTPQLLALSKKFSERSEK